MRVLDLTDLANNGTSSKRIPSLCMKLFDDTTELITALRLRMKVLHQRSAEEEFSIVRENELEFVLDIKCVDQDFFAKILDT